MTEDEMRGFLTERMNLYRTWAYGILVERISSGHFELIEAKHADGTCYQMSFDAFWDDGPLGNVRVCGSLWAEPQKRRRVLGLWVYSPHVTDEFIMAPNGEFVGEE